MDEKTLNYLEGHIIEMAQAAVKQAYWLSLSSGNSVLISDKGYITEVFPNGERKKIKKIKPNITVEKGKKITISK